MDTMGPIFQRGMQWAKTFKCLEICTRASTGWFSLVIRGNYTAISHPSRNIAASSGRSRSWFSILRSVVGLTVQ